MKAARLVVLGIALAAGGIAAVLASGGEKKPEAAPAPVAQLDTVDVLVAKSDIGMGQSVGADSLQWQTWPSATANTNFLRKDSRPRAVEEMSGAVARVPFAAGEPIRETKLIKANGSGFMAAILPTGMRAFSTDIPPETERSGFILPNDHVDVLLTRRDKAAEKQTGVDTFVTDTILSNIRVLAIDQVFEEKNGQKVVSGKTATLELTPRQAESLALSRQLGTISVALRSILDASGNGPEKADDRRASINMIRFGVSTTTTPK